MWQKKAKILKIYEALNLYLDISLYKKTSLQNEISRDMLMQFLKVNQGTKAMWYGFPIRNKTWR